MHQIVPHHSLATKRPFTLRLVLRPAVRRYFLIRQPEKRIVLTDVDGKGSILRREAREPIELEWRPRPAIFADRKTNSIARIVVGFARHDRRDLVLAVSIAGSARECRDYYLRPE